jgi:alkanesulfonate monooxygenase SsuD/methylene tetrahydromethanopterin reductase-like flavin-dependent oxidoreductase (luciferase family)
MALAGLARVTTIARLGVLLRAGARAPSVAAKALSTTDVLSGGRVIVGLDEPPVAGAAVLDALDEAVQVMRGAFGGGPFTFQGRYHRCEGLQSRPLPLQRPAPPIWVSGSDGDLLTVAARHADAWGPSGSACTREEYRSLVETLAQACEEIGRDPAAIHRFARREVPVDGAGDLGEDVAAWRELGVATLMLDRGAVALRAASGAALEHELEIVESAVSSAT